MFQTAHDSRDEGQNDLFPFGLPHSETQRSSGILLHCPSAVTPQYADLLRTLVLYRMVFGQNREDLIQYLLTRLPPTEVKRIAEFYRVGLSPTTKTRFVCAAIK